MKKFCLLIIIVLSIQTSTAQNMTNTILESIISTAADSVQGSKGRWQFSINDTVFICLTDSTNNRMRIISPIMESNRVSEELKTLSLSANFHTALDVKYAISDDILWSVFTHPLKALSEAQAKDAISQVYYANVNFGTSFASTSLVFPGRQRARTLEKVKELPKQKF